MAGRVAAPLAHVLDMALPPRCLSCQEPMAPPGGLCPDCWLAVHFLAEPLCQCCGAPLAQAQTEPCGHCLPGHSPLSRTRAAMLYDDGSRDLVLHLKHADALAGVPVMARWLQRAGAELLGDADFLIPVPLHWRRLLKRRYNQSAELGRALARLSAVKALPDGLLRTRSTPSQGGLSRHHREANVWDAFAVKDRYRERINGANIVLVDDVLTTGATLEACASVLLDAGAAWVDAVVLARVPPIERQS